MHDWTEYVRRHLPSGRLKSEREDEIVADLAQQLEEFYRDALAGGASEREAREHACRQVPDWESLARDIFRCSPGSRETRIDRWCENAATGPENRGSSLGYRFFSDTKQDLLHGVRILLKNPAFTAIALITLALGIGINTAVFSAVSALIRIPQNYPDPEGLVFVWGTMNPDIRFGGISAADARDWKTQSRSFSEISLFGTRTRTWTGRADADQIRGLECDASLMPMLGLRAGLGRLYRERDAAAGADPLVVISDTFWRTRLGANPGILGQTLAIDGVHHSVIGVLEPTRKLMQLTDFDMDILEPIPPDAGQADRGQRSYRVLARLRSHISLAAAQAEMNGITAALAQTYPDTNARTGVRLESLTDRFVSPSDRLFGMLLLVAVAAVLVIACINLANMLLAKATTRTREIAIRLALGAARMRIVRQLLTESLILSLAGGALGLMLAYGAVRIFFTSMADAPFTLEELKPDIFVLLYTLAISLATAAVFGLAPASMVSRIAVADSIKESGMSGLRGMSHSRFRNRLVVAELAVGLPLLICCGLAVRNLRSLSTIELGFNTQNLIIVNVELPRFRYDSEETWSPTYRQVIERLEAVPGVRAAGAILSFPVGSTRFRLSARARTDGKPGESGAPTDSIRFQPVTPGYFRAMEIPLVAGRAFTDRDSATSLPVAIVNRRMAVHYWQDSEPIGRRIILDPGTEEERTVTIVGVVHDAGRGILGEPVAPEMFVPHAQHPMSGMVVAVRTLGDPLLAVPEFRSAIRELDPDIPLYDIQTVPAIMHRWLRDDRMLVAFLAILAALSLGLAAVGLYGLMSYSVTQRTHEIGVRMALGAEESGIVRLVLRQCLTLSLIGIGIGFLISVPVGLIMGSQLYGVSGVDPVTFAGVSVLLLAVGLLAGYFPARRATRVDPVQALRQE